MDPVNFVYADRPTRIRTTTADGRQLSEVTFGGRIPQQIAADNNGGFIVVLPVSNTVPQLPSTIQRFDGTTGQLSWEYIGVGGFLTDVAIHPNGTIYSSEFHITGKSYLIAISPADGVTKTPLPQGHFTREDTGECGFSTGVATSASASHPIILEDGSVVLLTHESFVNTVVYSYYADESHTRCNQQTISSTNIQSAHAVGITAGGVGFTHELNTAFSDIPSSNLDKYQLLPDGHNGLLLVDRKRPWAMRVSSDAVVAKNFNFVPNDATRYYETEYVLGEDGAYAVANSSVFFVGSGYTYKSWVLGFDPQTLQATSASFLGNPRPEPQHIRIKFALGGGGAYAVGPSAAYVVNATADTSGFAAGGNASHVDDQRWAGWSVAPAFAVGAGVQLAETVWPSINGLKMFGNAAPPTWPSIRVNCRPLAGPLGFFADHCYLITRRSASDIRYVSSSATRIAAPGRPYGQNLSTDSVAMSVDDAQALFTHPWFATSTTIAALDCVTQNARIQPDGTWNLANLAYDPFDLNSNTFASWIVHKCNIPVRPSPFARRQGWTDDPNVLNSLP